MFFGPKPLHLALVSLFLALLDVFWVFLGPLGAKIPGIDGESSFSPGGAGQGQKSMGGEGLNLRGRENTAYISWLKSYATSKETLICIAWSEVSQIIINIH